MAKRKSINIYADLKEALSEAIKYQRGEPANVRVTVIAEPPKRMTPKQIRQVRKALDVSQFAFARMLNVSANTVESWEQGVRKPQAAALKLLHIAKTNPEVLLKVS